MRIAICDDDVRFLKNTEVLVKEYCVKNYDNDFKIKTFSTVFSLLDVLDKGESFNIFILDIVMPGMNGIDLGAKIMEKDNTSSIILLSTSRDFGIESYTIKATDYLLKPCDKEKLFASLDKASLNIKREKMGKFVMKVLGGVYAVPMSKILWVEYFDHRLFVHTVKGDIIEGVSSRKPFGTLVLPLLQGGDFVQTTASFLINMRHIKTLKSKEVILINEEVIPISRTYQKARSVYMDYILGEN